MRVRFFRAWCLLPVLLHSQALLAVEPSRWSTYQGSAEHNGFVDTDVRVPLVTIPRWSRHLVPATLAGGGRYIGLAIANQHVYVTSPERLAQTNPIVAVSLVDGGAVWERNFPGVNSVNPPAVSECGDVYLVTGNHMNDTFLHRLDGGTGQSLFSTPMDAQWQRYLAPTIVDDQVATPGGYFTSLFAFSLGGDYLYSTGQTNFDEWTPVPWRGNWVTLTDRLNIIDRTTGALQKSIPIPEYQWSGWSVWQTPVIASDIAYFTQGNRLIAIDLDAGVVRFIRPASDFQVSYLDSQISTDGEQLFVPGDSKLLVFDLEGNLLDTYINTPGAGFGPTNVITRSHVLSWSAFGQVNMFDRRTGILVQTFQGDQDVAAVALADGSLVVAYRDGRVSAYDVPFYDPGSIFQDSFESGFPPACPSQLVASERRSDA